MSSSAMSWAAAQRAGSPLAKLLLLRMADGVSCDGTYRFPLPVLRGLAEHCEAPPGEIVEAFRLLARRGLIDLDESGGVAALRGGGPYSAA